MLSPDYIPISNPFRDLRSQLIDSKRQELSRQMLAYGSAMLCYLDQPEEFLKLGIEFLVTELRVCRGDSALLSPDDEIYKPLAWWTNPASGAPDAKGFTLRNDLHCQQLLWRTKTAIAVADFANDPRLDDPLKEALSPLRTQAILVKSLSYRDEPLGIICVDRTDEPRMWSSEQIEILESFCKNILEPICFYGLQAKAERDRDEGLINIASLNEGELEAVKMIADGMSVGAIASDLHVSI
ncbi:MAG: GAF domain-containing protein, partial [Cyanobacteria bacterium J06639_1]